jgi:Ca2+/H+ antiporter
MLSVQLKTRQIQVLQTRLLLVVSNLMLGPSFLMGGLRFPQQEFNTNTGKEGIPFIAYFAGPEHDHP